MGPKRGRPRKKPVTSVDDEDGPSPQKARKVGTNAIAIDTQPEVDDELPDLAVNDVKDKTDIFQSPVVGRKRRGRPPKGAAKVPAVVVDSTEQSDGDTKAAAPVKEEDIAGEEADKNKKRGRKGKKNIGNGLDAGASVENNDADDADTEPLSSSNKKGRGTKGKKSKAANTAASKSQIKAEEEEEEEQPAAKSKGGQSKKSMESKEKASKGKENSDSSNIPPKYVPKSGADRVVMVKGRAAVDALCPTASNCHVYEDGEDIWDCMLNQTNIQFNNNKFYLIQLLKDDSKPVYSVWMRWGRVGANGQNSLQPCGSDLEKAKKIFCKKFSDKTKNEWDERYDFEKVPGKYDLLSMDYTKSEDTTDAAAAAEKANQERKKIVCQLEARVRTLIEMICDVKAMEEGVVEMKYDAKKAPLGKLTTAQLKAGYLALKKISELVESPKCSNKDLVDACNDFYTRIPHYFGMKVPPLIRTTDEVREKLRLLEALADIQAALSVLDQPIDLNIHPIDQKYQSLKCSITSVEKNSPDFKVIEKYMKTTHAKTHCQYSLELMELFSCHKQIEHDRFKDVGNRVLLWHGSRMSNMAGILSTGLRIAPPEAPVTGYMFGKGIYFADMCSKSANYCWATKTNNVGFLLLSEVSLGKYNELYHADYAADKLPAGCNSVKGCGRTAPLEQNYTKLSDGTVVPMGPGVAVKSKGSTGYSLLYNEYIVYDPAQVLTRFLLKIKFNFK